MEKHRTVFFQRTARFPALVSGIIALLLFFAPMVSAREPAISETPAICQQEDSPPTIGGKNSGIINLLLIGQDRRESETASRADSLVLCTFHKDSRKLTVTSFLRDLYVQIPGYTGNRINAAFALGGTALLRETFAENFGVYVDGCIEVDFSQFSRLIDLQGGVSIELRQDEADWINDHLDNSGLTQGSQLLTGEQALAYSRIRNLDSDGDFSRTNRQRKIISALFSGCKDTGLRDVLSFLEQAAPMFSTDLKKTRLLALAMELSPILSELSVTSQRIPAPGTCKDETIRGMAVLVADPDATRQYLRETLLEE